MPRAGAMPSAGSLPHDRSAGWCGAHAMAHIAAPSAHVLAPTSVRAPRIRDLWRARCRAGRHPPPRAFWIG
jgi:hypothetical protein